MLLSGTRAVLPSFQKQHLLVEFSSLRYARLDGVFVSITPGDPTSWVGVLFVRKGPYAPAVLRFQIAFPSSYPALPPLVIFSTDVFHPLLTPLTTHTYATGSSDANTVSATDEARLPPGGFSLRHRFPAWFERTSGSVSTLRQANGSASETPVAAVATTPAHVGPAPSNSPVASGDSHGTSIVAVLEYIRSAFSEETVLDSLTLDAAANPGAYRAWQTYRKPDTEAHLPSWTSSSSPSSAGKRADSSTPARNRRPAEWNWEGVWEERVRKAIKTSLSEPVLSGTGTGDDMIRFRSGDEHAQEMMARHLETMYPSAAPI